MRRISGLAEDVPTSRQELCSMELVKGYLGGVTVWWSLIIKGIVVERN
jgi:hypothetical protein